MLDAGYAMELGDGRDPGAWDIRGTSRASEAPHLDGTHDVLVVTGVGVMLRGPASIVTKRSAEGNVYEIRFVARPREGATYEA
jgi:hypothetical protein